MKRLCLVRHGETDWNRAGKIQGRENVVLGETGKLQARQCAQYLMRSNWQRIYSSPLKRAMQTAEMIREHLGFTRIGILESFIERDYGQASGLTRSERLARFSDGDIPDLETKESVVNRVKRGLNYLVEEVRDERIIVVSHGGTINAVLSFLSHGEIGTGKTVLGNGSINMLTYNDDGWHIEGYNLVDHLTKETAD